MSLIELAPNFTGSHTLAFEAKVVTVFQTGPAPDGVFIPLMNGSVTFDGTAKTRASGWLRTPGTDGQDGPLRWPRGMNQLFAPFGNEVFVRVGIDEGVNGIDWVPLGYLRITALEQDNAAQRPITMFLNDRMSTIRESDLLEPRAFQAGTTVGAIFNDLVREVYPEAVIVFDDGLVSTAITRQLIVERDRHQALLDIATSFGKIMFFDEEGVLQVMTAPSEDDITWEVNSGAGGVLVQARRQLTRERVFNAWVVTGEAADSDDPAHGIAVNNDPRSPTFFGGRFGKIPKFFSSPSVLTDAQARVAAFEGLRRTIGAPFNVNFSQSPNPRLRPFDVIRVTYDDGTRDIHIITRVKMPLDTENPIEAETREKVQIFIDLES